MRRFGASSDRPRFSVGIGEMPDAAGFRRRRKRHARKHIAQRRPMKLPNLCALGLGNISPCRAFRLSADPPEPLARCTSPRPARTRRPGIGRWPASSRRAVSIVPATASPASSSIPSKSGSAATTLGNMRGLGNGDHRAARRRACPTGSPIVYTSADSVFQVAAHEEVIPLEELYRICYVARELLRGVDEVGRVIARPFTGLVLGPTCGHRAVTTTRSIRLRTRFWID